MSAPVSTNVGPSQRIAIIGSGISGMAAGWYLSAQHEVTLFEADSRLGGHTATMDVNVAGHSYAIDTGFIVFNDWTISALSALDGHPGRRFTSHRNELLGTRDSAGL
ncbi:hypothetical protein HORIV_01950 [Vreelandella olivaria]|uniref:FAD-dependent oxidoreductase n=1 Tax=Vreelandella olivaria TaxID=390919 RepID=A0ABN5WL95_9GAMM|nr:hypothetical protein HORIV_01950 [Halomonas olivaria]